MSRAGKTNADVHGVTYPGVGGYFYYYPRTDHYLIVLSNYGQSSSGAVAAHINDLIEPNN